MKTYNILKITENRQYIEKASDWFSEKWYIPSKAYFESMEQAFNNNGVPEWYIILDNEKIIAGAGVIENDFHDRKDLTPNICALYVEEEYRNKGIAGEILEFICNDFKLKGITPLYLVTEHTSFYEKYKWEFLYMVEDEEKNKLRIYKK